MTARAVAVALFYAVVLTACGSSPKSGAGESGGVMAGGGLIEKADINGDGRPDMIRYFVEGGKDEERTLVRSELDLNFDGRIDKKNFFNTQTGTLEKVEINWDFDEHVDMINLYDEQGNIQSQKIDRDFDGHFDVVKRFKQGLLYTRALDTNADGKMDLWEYFSKRGKIRRIGKDLDGDGKPEYFEDVKKK